MIPYIAVSNHTKRSRYIDMYIEMVENKDYDIQNEGGEDGLLVDISNI